jgi:hypothetical protein
MWEDLTIMDLFVLVALAASLPVLVYRYVKPSGMTTGLQPILIVGGLFWLGFAFVGEYVSQEVLSVLMYDASGHRAWALILLRAMDQGDWSVFWNHLKLGNPAYHCYAALIMYLGCSVRTVTMLNGWFCFWGGLILIRNFISINPYAPIAKRWVLFTVFFPSVVFWGTMNLKEGLMYWSICCVLSGIFRDQSQSFILKSPLVIVGVIVGTVLRAHVMMGWAIATLSVAIMHRGRRFAAVPLLLLLPVIALAFKMQTGASLSTESVSDIVEQHFQALQATADQGSALEYTGGKPIFFISGFVSAFFRPFPWTVTSLRVLIQFLETWVLTVSLILIWYQLGRSMAVQVLKVPAIQVSLMATLWICMLLTYFPNEGLMVRQRVQMIPGLLTLAVVPMLVRDAYMRHFLARRIRQQQLRFPVRPSTATRPQSS